MNNGWMGKGDGVGGGSRGRGRGRGDLTRVKPLKPAKEVSDEKRSRGEEALFRVIKSKVEEEMEKEDKVEEELLVKNTPPLSKFAHICKTVRKKEERKSLKGFINYEVLGLNYSFKKLHATIILTPRRFWSILTFFDQVARPSRLVLGKKFFQI